MRNWEFGGFGGIVYLRQQACSCGFLQHFLLLHKPLDGGVETINLSIPSMATSGPSNLASRVDQIYIADLGVEQAHSISDIIGQTSSDIAR
jgi:hypothetical protein